jgi:dihydrofolate reductase
MGRIVVTEFISLDGVIEAPGGGEDYKYGGWTFEIDRGDKGNQFKLDETMKSAALLLGRRTYEGFAAAWLERDGAFADKFNTMPKYVVSSTLRPGVDQLDCPARRPGRRDPKLTRSRTAILWCTARQLVQSFIDNDLVDELRLMVFPVVLGTGKRHSARPPAKAATPVLIDGGRRRRRHPDLHAPLIRSRAAPKEETAK